MAAGPFLFPDKAILNFETLAVLGLTTPFKVTLHAATWVPVPATDEVYADATGELATAYGYTAGGVTLTGVTISQTAGITKFTAASAQTLWTAAGGSIPVWRYMVLRYAGTISGKVEPIMGYCLGDSTGIDAVAVAPPDRIIFTPNSLGILSVQRA
ncbi:MAG: hypothetical protein ABIO63_13595 [Casimicrobiaceae bacterium]